MKNKKITKLILTLATVSCMAALTGCNAEITLDSESNSPGTITIETTLSETPESQNVITANTNNYTVTQSNQTIASQDQSTQQNSAAETYNVNFDYRTEESTGCEYAVVTVTDSKGTSWSYQTSKVMMGQVSAVELLSSPANMTYINEGDTIVALDNKTGNTAWINSDYNGAGTLSLLDNNGNLYVSGGQGPALVIIDAQGNTLVKVDEFADYFWPSDMTLEGNMLTITFDCDDNASITMDIRDYSYEIN